MRACVLVRCVCVCVCVCISSKTNNLKDNQHNLHIHSSRWDGERCKLKVDNGKGRKLTDNGSLIFNV